MSHPGFLVRRLVTGWCVFAVIALSLAGLRAAPLERDLGDGLVYFRAASVPADLPTAESVRQRPCVLDLRYAKADGAAVTVFAAWLKFHAASTRPVFALVNGETAPALRAVLGSRDRRPGLLTVGIAGQPFAPDIVVHDTADNERRAYDALVQGTTITALTVDHPEKVRNDEASMSREASATANGSGATAKDPAPTPKDLVLQRALHLYRGLHALKSL